MSRTAVTCCVLGFVLLGAESLAAKDTMSFKLEASGLTAASFQACRQVGSENPVIEFRDGSTPSIAHKLPGNLSVFNFVCSRTARSDRSLWIWREMVEDGLIADARKNGTLTLFDQNGSPIAIWTFTNAWPAKIEVSSDQDLMAVETLTLAVERIDRIQ